MPPKDSKKALEKKKKATVEDRTFGLKNKNKSKKVQQYVKQVETSVATAGQNTKQRKAEEALRQAKENQKLAKEALEMEKAALFKSVVNKTVVPAGVDPKSVVCEFFKAGKCVRGAKCRYSHDVEQARKVAKIDLYSDPRALKDADTIDQWDTAKLEAVVGSKLKGKLPPTTIICKYFLDAIENSQYGWFWECPSGVECHYRHCLPPGYVLKTKAEKERAKREAEEGGDEEESLEEKIDQQRKQLDLSKCTPITLELFKKWKADKEAKRLEEVKNKREAAEQKSKGSGLNVMSGRDLFTFDPSLFVDDEEADDTQYEFNEEYDPAQHPDSEEDAPLYGDDDGEEDGENGEEGEEEDGEDGEEGEDEDEEDGEERKESDQGKHASASAAAAKDTKATGAIDASLFEDDDLPDDA